MKERIQSDKAPRKTRILIGNRSRLSLSTAFSAASNVRCVEQPSVEPARALLPQSALSTLDALPKILKNDSTEQLLREAAVVASERALCLRAVDAYSAQTSNVRTIEQCKTLTQWEYLTRQMVIAYATELASRETSSQKDNDDGG